MTLLLRSKLPGGQREIAQLVDCGLIGPSREFAGRPTPDDIGANGVSDLAKTGTQLDDICREAALLLFWDPVLKMHQSILGVRKGGNDSARSGRFHEELRSLDWMTWEAIRPMVDP